MTPNKHKVEHDVKLDVEARVREGVKAASKRYSKSRWPSISRPATGSWPRPGEGSATVVTSATS